MPKRAVAAVLVSMLVLLFAAVPVMASSHGKGKAGGVVIGGHIETSNIDSAGRVCMDLNGDGIDDDCNLFAVSSGEIQVLLPKNVDIQVAVVRVEFFKDGTEIVETVAEEADGTACNRVVAAYEDVMSFCYRDSSQNPQTGGQLDRFNLVIAQQSPQTRCTPVGDRVLACKDSSDGAVQ
jgi:hypothetical protein